MSENRVKLSEMSYQCGVLEALQDFGIVKQAQGQAPMDPSMAQQPQMGPDEMEMQAKQMKLDAESMMMQARQIKSQQQEASQQAAMMQQGVNPQQAASAAQSIPNPAEQGATAAAPVPMEQQAAAMQQPAPQQLQQPAPQQMDTNNPDVQAQIQEAFQYLLGQGIPEPQAITMLQQMLGGGAPA